MDGITTGIFEQFKNCNNPSGLDCFKNLGPYCATAFNQRVVGFKDYGILPKPYISLDMIKVSNNYVFQLLGPTNATFLSSWLNTAFFTGFQFIEHFLPLITQEYSHTFKVDPANCQRTHIPEVVLQQGIQILKDHNYRPLTVHYFSVNMPQCSEPCSFLGDIKLPSFVQIDQPFSQSEWDTLIELHETNQTSILHQLLLNHLVIAILQLAMNPDRKFLSVFLLSPLHIGNFSNSDTLDLNAVNIYFKSRFSPHLQVHFKTLDLYPPNKIIIPYLEKSRLGWLARHAFEEEITFIKNTLLAQVENYSHVLGMQNDCMDDKL